ncbi:hypothetical protein Tco_0880833 [Tanacetum coccineum]
MDVQKCFSLWKLKRKSMFGLPLGFEIRLPWQRNDKKWKDRQTLFIRRGPKVKFVSQNEVMGELTIFLRSVIKHKKDGIFISQDKYVTEILKKFGFTNVKTASIHMETQNPLLKDVHVCAYSPLDLVAYTDSDYAGANLDGKSTIGGCQFLGYRLISWQCKKQTVGRINVLICSGLELIKDDLKWNAKAAKDEIAVNSGKSQEGQTTTGKEFPNPLMAGSLPKTISTKWKVNVVRHNLMLLLKVNAVRHKLTTAIESC